jgi:hypothetical protein
MPKKTNKAVVKRGAPSKLEAFTNMLHEILEDDGNVVSWTDWEIVEEVNSRLAEDDRINERTLRRWKNKDFEEEPEKGIVFVSSYKKALRRCKRELIGRLARDDKSWQRYAWILERKFDEWNIKVLSETKVEHSGKLQSEQHVIDYSKLSAEALEEIVKAAESTPDE